MTDDMTRNAERLDISGFAARGWYLIEMPTGEPNVRCLRVPGGWLYQIELDEHVYSKASDDPGPDYTREGWHPPVFVPFAGDGRLT